MKPLILFRKTEGTRDWSSNLTKTMTSVGLMYNGNVVFFKNINLWQLALENLKVLRTLKNIDVVLVNHAITYYCFLPSLIVAKILCKPVFFLVHEHEYFLGSSYFFRYRKHLNLGYFFRSCFLYYLVPFLLSNKIIGLSNIQKPGIFKKKFTIFPFIQFDEYDKKLLLQAHHRWRGGTEKTLLYFAHELGRHDKGFRHVEALDSLIKCGAQSSVSNDNRFDKFIGSKGLILPSDAESFSLVFWEAFMIGMPIICSPKIGALDYLEEKGIRERLGIFVVSDEKYILQEIETFIFSCEAKIEFIFLERLKVFDQVFSKSQLVDFGFMIKKI